MNYTELKKRNRLKYPSGQSSAADLPTPSKAMENRGKTNHNVSSSNLPSNHKAEKTRPGNPQLVMANTDSCSTVAVSASGLVAEGNSEVTSHEQKHCQEQLKSHNKPKHSSKQKLKPDEKSKRKSATHTVKVSDPVSREVHSADLPVVSNMVHGVREQHKGDAKTIYQPNSSASAKKPVQSKQIYAPYWTSEMVQQGLKNQTLIQGVLRINARNYMDAYVPHPDNKSDIYIGGMVDRNRALNGDIVCVEVLPREHWKIELDELSNMELLMSKCSIDDSAINIGSSVACAVPVVKGAVESQNTIDSAVVLSEPDDDLAAADTTLMKHLPAETQNSASSSETSTGATPLLPTTDSLSASTPSTRAAVLQSADATGPEVVESGSVHKKSGRRKKSAKEEATPSKQSIANSSNKRDTPSRYKTVKDVQADAIHSSAVRKLFDPDSLDNNSNVSRLLIRTGKVVYITEKKQSRACCGLIKPMKDNNKQVALFAPTDHRIPRIILPMAQCPNGFLERPDDFGTTLFIARITEWEETSAMPKGELMRSLGEAGEVEPETEAILLDYMIDASEFSDEVIECLPKVLPWQIPAEEFEYRRDLRRLCIFTIDPSTARDLDDSLSCELLEDGLLEIGVHIADVTFFVQPDTALDKIASERATSVYLVQKVIPMLPRLLCEQLCSLNPNEDRLTFSVIWKMTSSGEIVDEWFGRTVINSCCKLSYEHAQGFIQEPSRDWTEDELPPISNSFTMADIRRRVLQLQEIAVQLRKKRFDNGALQLNQVKLQYTLNKETGLPNGYSVYEQKDSNRLIEEFMLLANMAVARKLNATYPDHAVLRRHPPPQSRMIDALEELCESFGIELDFSSSGALQRTLWAYGGDSVDEKARVQILTVLLSRPMQNAKYFCTGTLSDDAEYRHYALSVPLYTHFTSPIRRYPDVMVHRQLAAALGYPNCQPPDVDPSYMQIICEHCNDKKLTAKRASERSSELFFFIFLKECGPLLERAMVMNVMDHSFDVIVLKLGVPKRVYVDQLPLKRHEFKKTNKKPELVLYWAKNAQHETVVEQSVTVFTPVICRLIATNEPLKWNAELLHPADEMTHCFNL